MTDAFLAAIAAKGNGFTIAMVSGSALDVMALVRVSFEVRR